MSYSFRSAGARKLGYRPSQVDEFMARAREQYVDSTSKVLSADSIRSARFEVEKNGYSVSAVDLAMEKLEDIFAQRELERDFYSASKYDFRQELAEGIELLTKRANSKKTKKFSRRTWPNRGYSVKQVEIFCSLIATYLKDKADLDVKDVRLAVFKTQRGGYSEYQVDAFIEKVVEVIQREEILKKLRG